MFAVGPLGDIARYNGSLWSDGHVTPPLWCHGLSRDLRDHTNNIDAVGNGGLVEHWNGSAWSFQTRTGSGQLPGRLGGRHDAELLRRRRRPHRVYQSRRGRLARAWGSRPPTRRASMAVFGNAPTNVWVAGIPVSCTVVSSGTTLNLPTASYGTR